MCRCSVFWNCTEKTSWKLKDNKGDLLQVKLSSLMVNGSQRAEKWSFNRKRPYFWLKDRSMFLLPGMERREKNHPKYFRYVSISTVGIQEHKIMTRKYYSKLRYLIPAKYPVWNVSHTIVNWLILYFEKKVTNYRLFSRLTGNILQSAIDTGNSTSIIIITSIKIWALHAWALSFFMEAKSRTSSWKCSGDHVLKQCGVHDSVFHSV